MQKKTRTKHLSSGLEVNKERIHYFDIAFTGLMSAASTKWKFGYTSSRDWPVSGTAKAERIILV